MRKLFFIALVFISIFIMSCRGPQKVDDRLFGKNNTRIEHLDNGKKLIDLDWRIIRIDGIVRVDLWILTIDMTDKDSAQIYEYSNGVYKIKIIEHK
jgi:hypothetical protein